MADIIQKLIDIAIVDYKQKFKSFFPRETQPDAFGQTGNISILQLMGINYNNTKL